MERQLYTARLESKLLLSQQTQCFHLEFSIDELRDFPFVAGQFISAVADDKNGKQQTRAYSLASAPLGNRFDLCLNRVEGGFFSNLLCDLEVGQTVPFHGPHGMFTLRTPITDSILIATDTGVAPMRGFVQQLFPAGLPSTTSNNVWLVHGVEDESSAYYEKDFEKVAAVHPNFHYLTALGTAQEVVEKIVAKHATQHPQVEGPAAPGGFNLHAYICGLNQPANANREYLKTLGWQRKQIIFERYD